LTGEAESGLERLHQCAEKDLQAFLPSSKPDSNETTTPSVAEFGDFRVKLAGLTRYYIWHTLDLCVAVLFTMLDIRGSAGFCFTILISFASTSVCFQYHRNTI
jgi:hypothetical protein